MEMCVVCMCFKLLQTCQFNKQSSSTALFVSWGGVTRLCCCHGCCGRWFFTFDGSECSDPEKIEGVVYMANFNGADLHRHRTIQGNELMWFTRRTSRVHTMSLQTIKKSCCNIRRILYSPRKNQKDPLPRNRSGNWCARMSAWPWV